MIDEFTLIRRAQAGDATAFADLYRIHAASIAHYCHMHTSSPEDAEDATQTTFCNAWAAIRRYEDRGVPLARWLVTIAHHAVADIGRKRRTRATPLPSDFDEQMTDDEPQPDEVALRRDECSARSAALDRAITALPPARRQVVLARFAGDATSADIARAMHLSASHVRVIQFRALRQLRHALAT